MFKRFTACVCCGREIVILKDRWACPFCQADNRKPDYRAPLQRNVDRPPTGTAMTRKAWDVRNGYGYRL